MYDDGAECDQEEYDEYEEQREGWVPSRYGGHANWDSVHRKAQTINVEKVIDII